MAIELYIGVPCYGGQMHAGCTYGLIMLLEECKKHNIECKFDFIYNQSLITVARDRLANKFLESPMTHLLFIDSDIQFEAADVIQMIQSDKDIIGGIYGRKIIHWDRIAECVKQNKSTESLPYNTSDLAICALDDFYVTGNYDINEPLEVKYIATGMMLIKRHVLEKMRDAFPNKRYTADNAYYHNFFDCKIKGENYLSEDNAFCDNWRELGGKIYAALWTKTIHYGNIGIHTNILKR